MVRDSGRFLRDILENEAWARKSPLPCVGEYHANSQSGDLVSAYCTSKQHYLHLTAIEPLVSSPPNFHWREKKVFNQDRHCCCSSSAVALLSCPALISFQSGTALPLLTQQGFSRSLSLAFCYVLACHCPRRCLITRRRIAPTSYSKIPIKRHGQGLISYHLPAVHRTGP